MLTVVIAIPGQSFLCTFTDILLCCLGNGSAVGVDGDVGSKGLSAEHSSFSEPDTGCLRRTVFVGGLRRLRVWYIDCPSTIVVKAKVSR